MKKHTPKLLIGAAILSLLLITAVVATGFGKKIRLKEPTETQKKSDVLGELTRSLGNSTFIDTNAVANTIEDTKETVSTKAKEVEKAIIKTVEKEVTTMTQSQINSVKRQICQNWGVITPQPTKGQE